MGRPDEAHVCWGCRKPIGDDQPHIHVGLDEWSGSQGLASLDLGDDDIVFPFCEPCTVDAERGWQLEAHTIKRGNRDG